MSNFTQKEVIKKNSLFFTKVAQSCLYFEGIGVPSPIINSSISATIKFLSVYTGQPFHNLQLIHQLPKNHNIIKESYFETFTQIYKKEGIKGLFQGSISNGSKLAARECYRFPIINELRSHFNEVLPEHLLTKFPYLPEIMVAPLISILDVAVAAPLDRINNVQTTAFKLYGIKLSPKEAISYLNQKNNLTSELYRGATASFIQSNISWGSFLLLNKILTQKLNEVGHNVHSGSIPLILGNAGTGVILAYINNPFAVIRNQLSNAQPLLANSFLEAVLKITKEQGYKAWFSGVGAKVGVSIMGSVVTGTMIQFAKDLSKYKDKIQSQAK